LGFSKFSVSIKLITTVRLPTVPALYVSGGSKVGSRIPGVFFTGLLDVAGKEVELSEDLEGETPVGGVSSSGGMGTSF
jgi:hypothetical protein